MISPRLAKFIVAGGIAAAANFLSRLALSAVVAYPVAIVLAYCVGMATAFVLNRKFVFQGAGNTLPQQAFWFIVINLLAVAQTLAVSLILAKWMLPWLGVRQHAETIAHAVGVVVPIFTSYVGHRRLTFRAEA